MYGERFTLTLRHEFVHMTDEGIKVHQMEPPLSVCFSIFEMTDHGYIAYGINEALHRLEHEFLNRFDERNGSLRVDGGADDAAD